MRKIPDLSLKRRRAHKLCGIFIALSLGCGHYQGPQYDSGHTEYSPQASEYTSQGEYSPQGEFVAPDEYATPRDFYNSEDVLKTQGRTHPSEGAFQLQWPVKRVSLNRGYSEAGQRAHLGLDLGGAKGTSIFAAHSGVIIYAGAGFRGYGKMIILEYNDNWASLYGHLNQFKVKAGDIIEAGQLIGYMGRTGRASGVHLHFELMKSKVPIDPLPLMPADSADTRDR